MSKFSKQPSVLMVSDNPGKCKGIADYLTAHGLKTIVTLPDAAAIVALKGKADAIIIRSRSLGSAHTLFSPFILGSVTSIPSILIQEKDLGLDDDEIHKRGFVATIRAPFKAGELENTIMQSIFDQTKLEVDRRRHSRFQLHQKILWKFSSMVELKKGEIQNLSLSGMFIHSLDKLPKRGAMISFEIYINDVDLFVIQGVGTVRWTRSAKQARKGFPAGFGLEFTALSKASSDVIEFLRAQRQRAH